MPRSRKHCYWCSRKLVHGLGDKSPLSATRDHVYPKSKNGDGWTVWACWTCNNVKGDMTPNQWAVFRARNPQWWTLSNRAPHSRPKRSIG